MCRGRLPGVFCGYGYAEEMEGSDGNRKIISSPEG